MGFSSADDRLIAAWCYIMFPCGPILSLFTWLKDKLSILWDGILIKISPQKASLYNLWKRHLGQHLAREWNKISL